MCKMEMRISSPQNSCSACRLKLARYRQNKASCSINFCEIYEFELHSTECKICISKSGRPKKIGKTKL